MNLKKIFPRSLYKRFVLIIALPIIIIQLVSIYVFYYTHLAAIGKHMIRSNVDQIILIAKNYNDKIIHEFGSVSGVKFELINSDNITLIDSEGVDEFSPLYYLKLDLESKKIKIYNARIDEDEGLISFVIKNQNQLIEFKLPIKRIVPSRSDVFIFWLVFTSLITLIISIIFLRNQIKYLNILKDVAEKFGRGQDVGNIKPGGAEEIRSLALSFIRMRDRVLRQVTQRTIMLSAVSHDLRTPLTRMKLQIAMMPKTEEIDELKKDISDMENIVDEYLEFAGSDKKEKSKKINFTNFLKNDVINYYSKIDNKIAYKLEIDSNLKVSIKKTAIKRSLINLIDNAFNYGDKIEINVSNSKDNLIIDIEDNGPGIPSKERNKVLKPFYRIDNSRNLDKDLSQSYKIKGSGLGLSIANDAISSHGGRIKLSKSTLGGLKVTLYIPL
jgi:two-component system osmolarity sensor histidine kinase EnvZ